MGLFSRLFKKKKKNKDLVAHSNDLSMEEIEKIQLSLKDKMDADVYNSIFNQACRLIPKGQYEEAIAMFSVIEENSTDTHEKGNCQNQIGVCHFFLGDFEKAIGFYVQSYKSGFNKSMMDDNIWEACEELMKKDGDKAKWAQYYLSILPDGNYAGKAQKSL